ncbi:MAG: 16S rRNA (guanine(527)-N(7))-methyltransferase RsmG [Solobacterium sp.]|nr:16S rRNA (guanine(527)-N(7))-methyltransferase RsmG [Solobacterium sp.]
MTIEELMQEAQWIKNDRNTAADAFHRYLDLLLEWNQKMNLTAIKEPSEVVEKHFYDCLLPLSTGRITGAVCDVGSGAGFPSVVWKIADPSLDITIVEPTGKRCTFLEEVIRQLHLTGIHVVNQRAEEHVKECRERYDVVTARAVASLPVLAELCIPLVRKDGLFAAMKGAKGTEEAHQAEHAMQVLGAKIENVQECTLHTGDVRINLYYRKHARTPVQYPRNYAQIKKKPL